MNDDPLLRPGPTCWRIERAERLAMIVDAADYFRFVKAAMLKARHSIMLIGWDFDTRIVFEPDQQTVEGPNKLGEFLSWLPTCRKDLQIYVLKWDLGVIQSMARGMTPFFIADWITDRHLHFKLDHAHPAGAAHHQKIVVIDDALAFCGGIDVTVERWDTREHLDENPCRKKPNGRLSGPWHDATTAVDGAAASALGDLARERWRRATGDRLERAPEDSDPWPASLEATMENVDVAIARTVPEFEGQDKIAEIEALHLEAIARAERVVYIETQYLASRRIAEAFARRLAEPDGPEIVLVLPRTTEGWLEHKAMDGARRKLLHLLWNADTHRRFGAFYAVTAGGQAIYVHAKIMVVDDGLLRVGSSNLNNRSMGFDTECDLAVEVTADTVQGERLRETILAIRTDLLCEHLDVGPGEFARAVDGASGSILKAIQALRGTGRSLRSFKPDEVEGDASPLAENEVLDPEQPPKKFAKRVLEGISDVVRGRVRQDKR